MLGIEGENPEDLDFLTLCVRGHEREDGLRPVTLKAWLWITIRSWECAFAYETKRAKHLSLFAD